MMPATIFQSTTAEVCLIALMEEVGLLCEHHRVRLPFTHLKSSKRVTDKQELCSLRSGAHESPGRPTAYASRLPKLGAAHLLALKLLFFLKYGIFL